MLTQMTLPLLFPSDDSSFSLSQRSPTSIFEENQRQVRNLFRSDGKDAHKSHFKSNGKDEHKKLLCYFLGILSSPKEVMKLKYDCMLIVTIQFLWYFLKPRVHVYGILNGISKIFCQASYAISHGHGHPEIIKAFTLQAKGLTLISRALYNDKF